jgi:hypothetical protein
VRIAHSLVSKAAIVEEKDRADLQQRGSYP